MQVMFNGQVIQLEQVGSLQDLLIEQLQTGVFAVAVNQTFVPASDYETTQLKTGDQIDIIEPMQGG